MFAQRIVRFPAARFERGISGRAAKQAIAFAQSRTAAFPRSGLPWGCVECPGLVDPGPTDSREPRRGRPRPDPHCPVAELTDSQIMRSPTRTCCGIQEICSKIADGQL